MPGAEDALQPALYAALTLSALTGVASKVLAIRRKQLQLRRERQKLENKE